MEKESLKNITKSLINRNFQIADIKTYLADKNYSIDEIESVLSEIKNNELENPTKSISKKKGLKGFSYIISGIILFIFSFINLPDNDNKLFIFLRILLALGLFFYGIFLATRPLQNNQI